VRRCVVLICVLFACKDLIHVRDVPEGTECGILVDGKGDEILREKPMRSDHPVFGVKLSSRTDLDSVVAFAHGRSPAFALAHWTNGVDLVLLWCPPPTALTITAWIVGSDGAAEVETRVGAAVADANALFASERVGVVLLLKAVHVVTAPASEFEDFNLVVSKKAHDDLGCDAAHFNVYIAKKVLGVSGGGMWDETVPDVIALGREFSRYLLAHEVGHALDLHHPDSASGYREGFDATNLMASNSADRYYVAEGQTFRAHFCSKSHIHSSWRFHDEAAYINRWTAGENDTLGDYPPARWRIWPDGSMPADDGSGAATSSAETASAVLSVSAMPGAYPEEAGHLQAALEPVRAHALGSKHARAAPAARLQLVAGHALSAEAYCLSDCDIGNDGDAPVTPEPAHAGDFVRALEDGPSAELVARVTAMAERAFAAREAFLWSDLAEATLPPNILANVRARTLPQEIADTKRCLELNYRGRAIQGVTFLRTRAALPALRRIADEHGSPLREAAEQAIIAIGP